MLIMIGLAISLSAACATRLSFPELVGTYRAEHPEGYSILILRADMSYTQTLHYSDDGRVVTASGKWSYDSRFGHVILENGGYAITGTMLGWRLPAPSYGSEMWFGRVYLVCDPDADVEYKKVQPLYFTFAIATSFALGAGLLFFARQIHGWLLKNKLVRTPDPASQSEVSEFSIRSRARVRQLRLAGLLGIVFGVYLLYEILIH